MFCLRYVMSLIAFVADTFMTDMFWTDMFCLDLFKSGGAFCPKKLTEHTESSPSILAAHSWVIPHTPSPNKENLPFDI